MKTKLLILALVLALSLMAAGAALANNGIVLARDVLSGGATDATSGAVSLRATFGQPVVGVVSGSSSAGEVTLGQGFWHGGEIPEPEVGFDVYLPLIHR